jgi:hypothetical protein
VVEPGGPWFIRVAESLVQLDWQLAGSWDGNGRSDYSSAAVIEALVPLSQLRLQILAKSVVTRNLDDYMGVLLGQKQPL